jgi:K+-sensing histidine kinase KdpD
MHFICYQYFFLFALFSLCVEEEQTNYTFIFLRIMSTHNILEKCQKQLNVSSTKTKHLTNSRS